MGSFLLYCLSQFSVISLNPVRDLDRMIWLSKTRFLHFALRKAISIRTLYFQWTYSRCGLNIIIGYYHLWYISGRISAALLLLTFRNRPIERLSVSVLPSYAARVFIQYSRSFHLLQVSILNTAFNLHWPHGNFLFLAHPFLTIR